MLSTKRFHLSEEGGNGVIQSAEPPYRLVAHPWGSLLIEWLADKGNVAISGRSFDEYVRILRLSPDLPGGCYLEVGPGLGGFLPMLVTRFRHLLTAIPVAVDPVDYAVLRDMIDLALEHEDLLGTGPVRGRLMILRRRCEILLDPTRVRHVRMTAGEASELPELRKSADVVVELCGPTVYPHTEPGLLLRSQIVAVIDSLRRPDGVLLRPV